MCSVYLDSYYSAFFWLSSERGRQALAALNQLASELAMWERGLVKSKAQHLEQTIQADCS